MLYTDYFAFSCSQSHTADSGISSRHLSRICLKTAGEINRKRSRVRRIASSDCRLQAPPARKKWRFRTGCPDAPAKDQSNVVRVSSTALTQQNVIGWDWQMPACHPPPVSEWKTPELHRSTRLFFHCFHIRRILLPVQG